MDNLSVPPVHLWEKYMTPDGRVPLFDTSDMEWGPVRVPGHYASEEDLG